MFTVGVIAGPTQVGVVAELWRYPVKSMGGSRVDESRLGARGLHADRLWAVRDMAMQQTISARRVPALLGCTARYADEPGPDAGPGRAPAVIVTLPDGVEIAGDDPVVHERLSELTKLDVQLVPLVDDRRQQRMSVRDALDYARRLRGEMGIAAGDPLPDVTRMRVKPLLTLARYSTPPATFVDLSPVHVLTDASLATLATSMGRESLDVRRFRPNVLLGGVSGEYPEAGWDGSELRIGDASLRITMSTVRCVVPTRAQPGLDVDPAVGRVLTTQTGRFLGAYADVERGAVIRVGDQVWLAPPRPPSRLQAATTNVARRATQRVLRAADRFI